MTNTILQTLDDFGLSEKEAAVYLAALELGRAAAGQLAIRAKVNRATTYLALEELISRELIREVTVGKKRYFMAENPHRLVAMAEANKQRWSTRLHQVETVLPDLENLYKQIPGKPQVQFYTGLSGLKRVLDDSLEESNTSLLIYVNVEEAVKALGSYWDSYYIPTRRRRNITARAIMTDTREAAKRIANNNNDLREARVIPNNFSLSNEVIIYSDKVAILSFTDPPIGVILQNPEIAATQRAIFELAWQAAGQFPKNKAGSPGAK